MSCASTTVGAVYCMNMIPLPTVHIPQNLGMELLKAI